jgi:hypothetical protein
MEYPPPRILVQASPHQWLAVLDLPGGRRGGDARTLLSSGRQSWRPDCSIAELRPPPAVTSPAELAALWCEQVTGLGRVVVMTLCGGATVGELLAYKARAGGAEVAGIVHVDPSPVGISELLDAFDSMVDGDQPGGGGAADQTVLRTLLERREDGADEEALSLMARRVDERFQRFASTNGLTDADCEVMSRRCKGWLSYLLLMVRAGQSPHRPDVPRVSIVPLGADVGIDSLGLGTATVQVPVPRGDLFRSPDCRMAVETAVVDCLAGREPARPRIAESGR